ncbi:MAG TPA: LacI family DNA-binding transcriptional regulator [Bacillota bacterium]|nr:LacI family DNA-binding transcriptional regulator [Bacillota bacterium]
MINMKKVAEDAGVSVSTVSRVLSGSDCVKEKTRLKVLEAANRLNFQPNILAQGLKLGYTSTIALMVPSIENQIFPVIARGVEDVARKNGFTVILCNTDEDMKVEKEYITKLKTRWIDGFIVASMLPDSDHIRALCAENFPVVLVCRYYDESISAVAIDNYHAAYDAVCHLIKSGHKRIAFASGRLELSFYQKRYQGYLDALKDHGLAVEPKLIMHETNGSQSFYYLTQQLLKEEPGIDAVFASSDPKAIVVMRAIQDLGLRIPEDISVMGFDNIGMSNLVEPPLSTVSQPLYEIGALAAKKLIRMIKGNGSTKPVIDFLKTDLIIRKSTR